MKSSIIFLFAIAGAALAVQAAPIESTDGYHLQRRQFGRFARFRNRKAAAEQDASDAAANTAAASAAAPAAEAVGGVGGVDPATGETLLALPEASAFCTSGDQSESDGTQKKTGDCSSLPQGQIPSTANMVSTIITQPTAGQNFGVNQGFTVAIKTTGLQTGFFTDAKTEYYTQPQTLNAAGQIKGHQHITIQNMGDGTTPPDPNVKAFFKGLNDAADANGVLSVDVPPLNATGTFRICSMSSSFSHQPVVMPIAQRGAQDDCIRITVGGAAAAAGAAGAATDAAAAASAATAATAATATADPAAAATDAAATAAADESPRAKFIAKFKAAKAARKAKAAAAAAAAAAADGGAGAADGADAAAAEDESPRAKFIAKFKAAAAARAAADE